MGAWGHGPFDNDSAGDWVDQLSDAGTAAIDEAFEAVIALDDSDYLELDPASAAIAAADLVSRAHDGVTDSLSEEAALWLAENREAAKAVDRTRARLAVERVYRLSELRELWDENGPDTEWHADTRELLQRLARS